MDRPERKPGEADRQSPAATAPGPPWLLRQRVRIPAPAAGFCERPELARRCVLDASRIVLLMAPGGFGKTTLLADRCREARRRGVATAWLSLEAEDTPELLDACVGHAFAEAGLEITPSPPDDGQAPYPTTRAVLQALERQRKQWTLVVDELENLTDAESVGLLDFLLRTMPACLHLALGCRELPGGLDAAAAAFDADAEIVTAEHLQYSREDVARFFDHKLSRAELSAVVAESGGWPVALRAAHERLLLDAGGAVVAREVLANWLEGRFLGRLRQRDRQLILDVGLFDWFDAALLEEVFEQPGALERLHGMATLSRLVAPVRRGEGTYRLNPSLRRHSEARDWRDPKRNRRTRRRIGIALARRGETVAGMRHAVAADDPELAARILIEGGGLAVWLARGSEELLAADRLLTERAIASDVRLALVRCAALTVTGDVAAARRTLAAAGRELRAAAKKSSAFAVELCLVRGVLARTGCESVGDEEVQAVMAEIQRMAALPTVPAVVRATMACGLCTYEGMRAEFDTSLDHYRRSRELATRRSPYITSVNDLTYGQAAMAQGRVQEALTHYRRARQTAATQLAGHDRLIATGVVLRREIDLERNRLPEHQTSDLKALRRVLRGGVDFGSHAAASDLAVEHGRRAGGTDGALAVLDDIWERARRSELPALERHLAGVRVGILAGAGRIAEAGQTWDAADLPRTDAGCVDLRGQSWREMETLCCARMALLLASGDHGAARRFGQRAAALAVRARLLRTRLRLLAARAAVEASDGNRDQTSRLVREYLKLSEASDYVRPLLSIGAAAQEALARDVREHPGHASAGRTDRLLAWMADSPGGVPAFPGKQRAVLAQLTQPDKDIAAALDLTLHGVRYHVRQIFSKLDVNDRTAAIRRAQELGIV